MSSQTVFVQFRFCPLCRISYKSGKKHAFSRKHQDIVARILIKFKKKVDEAQEFLTHLSVKDLTWNQAQQTFWCYFCQQELLKHKQWSTTKDGDCFVECGGFLEHIVRSDHAGKTAQFLKENRLDMKRTSEFVISSKLYLKYLEDLESACSQFFERKSQITSQIASQLRRQSAQRQQVVANTLQEQSLTHQVSGRLPHAAKETVSRAHLVRGSLSAEERGRKTVQAFGDGLTAVDRSHEDDSAGNIYTNAVPPWLISKPESGSSSGVVGPTLADLELQKKLERKKQLPPDRVGAKFNRKLSGADSWMPDFGGVWNHGRRTKTGQLFLKRQAKQIKRPSTSGADVLCSDQSTAAYTFPKLLRRTATSGSSSDNSSIQVDDHTQFPESAPPSSFPPSDTQNELVWDNSGTEITSPASTEFPTATTSFASTPFSDFIGVLPSSLGIKPYVKKFRKSVATVFEPPAVTVLEPHVLPLNTQLPGFTEGHNISHNISTSGYNDSLVNSLPHIFIPPASFQPVGSSSTLYQVNSRGGFHDWSGAGTTSKPDVERQVGPTKASSLRLISTPVLSSPTIRRTAPAPPK